MNRTQLAFFPLLIDNAFIGSQIHFFRDGLGIGSQHDPAHTDFWVTGYIQQMLEKGASLIGEERLRRSHPARCAARADDGCEHAPSFSVPSVQAEVRTSISCGPPILRCGEWQSTPQRY